MRTTAASVLLLLVLVVADAADAATRPRLKAFDDCRSLVDYARAGALRTQGGVGVDGRAAPPMVDAVVTPQIAPPMAPEQRTSNDTAAGAPAPVSGGTPVAGTVPEFSGTNVQELGVDEPDILKTDGRRIFAVTDRTLRVVDPASGQVTGSLALDGFGHRLLLRGDRVLVVASKGDTGDAPAVSRPVAPTIAPVSSLTIVTELDVSDATPKVMRTMEVPGRFVDARQNGATARLVIDSEPEPFIATPQETVSEQVRDARRGDFLQRTVLRSELSGKTYRRDLAPCKAITHPTQFSGTGVLAILTVDLDRGMYSLDRDGVMAGAQVVYGSEGSLYVASRRYVRALELGQDVPEGLRTEIHRFDISNPERTIYRSTGTVPGFILNNYALSEFDGHLRVASTEEPTLASGRHGDAEPEHGHGAQGGRRAAGPRRVRQRARPGRAHLRRAVHGREGLRRHVPPGRPAVHARPEDALGAEGRRRAEDPRLLGVPAPGRRRTGCWASAARAPACRRRCSTSPTWRRRSGSRS